MASLKIEQTEWLRGKQSFEVRDKEESIRVMTHLKGVLNEYQIPLNIIHPEPNRLKINNGVGLGTMAVCSFLSIAVIVLGFHEPAFLMMLIFLLPLAIAGFLQFKKMSVDAQIFRSRINGQNLLVIWRDVPSKKEFESFVGSFQEKLKKIEIPIVNAASHSVAEEIRKLGELKKDGLLSEKEFEEAKVRLLGSLEKREIGFK